MNRCFRTTLFCLIAGAALSAGCASSHRAAGVQASAPGRDTARARELNDRAFALIGQGKFSDADQLLRDAVAADPMYGPARNNLGLVYYEDQRLYEAAWEFENAIRLMPYQPEPRNNLGLALERAGKLGTATDAYAKARDMEPDNPEFLSNLARAKVRRGDCDAETRKLLEEVAMKDPRPQWSDWAKTNLFRISREAATEVSPPATQP